jgi:hypothetical protein
MRERISFEREMEDLLGEAFREHPSEGETFDGLQGKLTHLSFFPHWVDGGAALPMTPGLMNPGFYDGPAKYKLSSALQPKLYSLVKRSPFGDSRVALVDLTKGSNAPEFAGVRYAEQVFIASVAKIAPLFAAFQLQQDIREMARRRNPIGSVFHWARERWADTQHDPGGAVVPFTRRISLTGKLVLVNGKKLPLIDPRTPDLDIIFESAASPFAFRSNPTTFDDLKTAIRNFARGGTSKTELLGKPAIDALAFWQRMMVVGGGLVPASNYAVATLVRDLGFAYIASSLIQSGLYDPARGGGLWLGADHDGILWSGAPAGGSSQSGTAGSLAAYMTLLAQDRLVSASASRGIRALLDKDSTTAPTLQSPFENAVERKFGSARVFEKLGAAAGGVDECALIEWPAASPRLRYVAISLRSSSTVLEKLIVELHKIVAANNGVPVSA